jgi:hypothetical protein
LSQVNANSITLLPAPQNPLKITLQLRGPPDVEKTISHHGRCVWGGEDRPSTSSSCFWQSLLGSPSTRTPCPS